MLIFLGKREGHLKVMKDPGLQNELSYPKITHQYDLELSNFTEGNIVNLICESSRMKPAPR